MKTRTENRTSTSEALWRFIQATGKVFWRWTLNIIHSLFNIDFKWISGKFVWPGHIDSNRSPTHTSCLHFWQDNNIIFDSIYRTSNLSNATPLQLLSNQRNGRRTKTNGHEMPSIRLLIIFNAATYLGLHIGRLDGYRSIKRQKKNIRGLDGRDSATDMTAEGGGGDGQNQCEWVMHDASKAEQWHHIACK